MEDKFKKAKEALDKNPFKGLNAHAAAALTDIMLPHQQEEYKKNFDMEKPLIKLIKIRDQWYLTDNSVPPTEGGVAIYDNTTPVYTNFIDEKENVCSIGFKTSQLDYLQTVMGSTNPLDGSPMLDKSKFNELGIQAWGNSQYLVEYTIRFKGDKQIAALINGYVNILEAKKQSN